MFSIGDFARYGRVSVRMLRHYDAIGLLRPARVDPTTGYRFYTAGQLALLNRIVALKELGFTLGQVQQIIADRIPVGELRGMLRLRRAELEARIAADTGRLAQVQARLHMIEKEGAVPVEEITVKSIPAVRVAELTGTAAGLVPEAIGPVVRGLFDRLCPALGRAGITPVGPAIAYYDEGDDEVTVHAAVPVGVDPAPGFEFVVVDLPAVPLAATLVHRGSMDGCLESYQTLARWIEVGGYRSVGPAREVTLDYPADPDGMVTEIQEPIVKD